ncbi:integrase, catalytic region, zinc finger, CCHC-type containing protein [Tanacetum coccineum]
MLFTMPSWKQVTKKTAPVLEGSPETTTEGYMENYKNVSQDIRDQLNAKAEAVQIILTGIVDDIYSTVDACLNACEMWKAIERLKQDDEMSKDKEIDKLMALISLSFKKIYKPTNKNLKTSSNTSRANRDNTPRINKGTGYDNQRVVNVAGTRENVEQADWRDATNDEPKDQELEAHYMYIAQIQKVTPDAVDNSRPIFDAEPLQKDDDLAKEHDLLASLIEKLKCEIDDSKNCNKFLETSNKDLVDKLKGEIEDFKTKNKSLESSNNHFKEANNELSKTNQLMFKDLKKFQAEFDRYHDVNYASKVEIDCAKAKRDLMSYKMESKKSFNEYNRKINDLNQTISKMKKELFAHQETISIMSQEKEAQIKFYKTCEDKEIEKVIALENKVKALDDIVYKTGQSVQTMNILNRNCKTSFVKPEFLKKAQRANPHLHDIGCYNDNLALILAPESDEMIRLAQESRSKLSDLIRPFDYKNLNNLYDLFIPQRKKSFGQRYFLERSKMSHTPVKNENSKESFNKQTALLEKRMDESIPWDQKCKSSKELFKIKRSVDTIFDEVERCKQTIAKRTYFGHIDPFIQNTIEGNFCPQIRRINADLEKFHLCLKEEMVANLRYFNSLEHEVDSLKSQLETQKTQFLNEIDRLSRKYYYADHMNAILGVYTTLDEFTDLQCEYVDQVVKCKRLEKELSKIIPTTSVNRLQLKRNQLEDKVMPNNSQAKKQEVEDHRRNFKFSNNKTSLIEIMLFIIDSGCSKHMIGNFKLLSNFVEKFLGTVKFGNDQISPILGYEDLVQGKVTIKRVYYIEGLNHNFFFVVQFCDVDLEVDFWKSTCYIYDLKGNDLLTCSHGTYLYSITLQDTSTPNLICLMAKASSSQAWLWHRRLSHLNFDTINLLLKYDIMIGLPKLKFIKDHLCSSCELGKAKQNSFHTKTTPSSKRRLKQLQQHVLHRTVHSQFLDIRKHLTTSSMAENRYSTQSRAYRVYNKRTRVIVKTIHVNFDELPQMASNHISSDSVLQCPTMALEHDSLRPGPQSQENGLQAAETVTTSNELDLLFSLIFDELLNGNTQVVSKSSVVTTTDAPNQRQQQHTTPSTSTTVAADTPSLNIQTTPETTSQVPTVTATENIN